MYNHTSKPTPCKKKKKTYPGRERVTKRKRPGWDDVKAPFSCQIISVLYVFILLDSGHDHFINGARAERETNFNEAITLRGTAIENPYRINNLLWHSCVACHGL